jgi:hypothetical protein
MARPPATRTSAARPVSTGKQRNAPAAAGQGERQNAPVARKNGKNATLVLGIVVMLVLALFERPICLLLVLALVPTMLAWLVDDTPGQSLIRTVAPLNLASSLPFAIKLWHEHTSLDQVFVFMSGRATWIALYGAATFGWMLYYLAPAVISTVVQRRIERLRDNAIERQKALKDEWGDEVEK